MVNNDSNYAGPRAAKKAFTNRLSHPLLLDLLMVKEFGPEYLSWEPETCWAEIKLTWNTTISENSRNKLQAVRTCHVSDQPYESWNVFEKVCMALAGVSPRFDLVQRVSPHVMALALDIMGQVKDKKAVSKEVYRYVGAALLDDGMAFGPGPLEPCNKYIADRVSTSRQELIKKALKGNTRDLSDVQIMKSQSVLDYVEGQSRALLSQLKVIFP
tara:strand:- start:1661 stop:2302 length:642 start_codon:yes stop_codon:yes gene_type:complete